MDRRRSAAARVFEDFDPEVEWKLAGEDQDVVEITLPGFRKDQVRVQVDNHGVLRATGERPTRGGRWARFKKDLRLPDNCDADGVRARFEGEKLIITLPIAAATPPHSPTPSPPEPRGPPRTEPPPPQGKSPPLPPPRTEPPPRRPPSPPPPPRTYPEPPRQRPSPPQPPKYPEEPPPPPRQPPPSHPPPPPGPPMTKPATAEQKPSTPPLWQPPVSVSSPPAPLPPRGAEEPQPPKKQLEDTSTMAMVTQDDGKDSRPPPPPPSEKKKKSKKTKRADEPAGADLRGKVDETARGAKRPENNQAGAPPAVGDDRATATMTPEPARQLLVNAAAAVAVLVGIVVAVWRTLQS